ncbi:hypothetical protein SAMN04487904_102108 [Actinopolyspora lacussalsi subsp. righensis]|uniref:Uncharacterized protein n=1 Tax=Actinopolyspora righensis TaxID=995060 RepID=A0A1I6Y1R5_9ACTN|nr:hypothetical protein SAMN04487904_102108 [Actinopolyspora righensis]
MAAPAFSVCSTRPLGRRGERDRSCSKRSSSRSRRLYSASGSDWAAAVANSARRSNRAADPAAPDAEPGTADRCSCARSGSFGCAKSGRTGSAAEFVPRDPSGGVVPVAGVAEGAEAGGCSDRGNPGRASCRSIDPGIGSRGLVTTPPELRCCRQTHSLRRQQACFAFPIQVIEAAPPTTSARRYPLDRLVFPPDVSSRAARAWSFAVTDGTLYRLNDTKRTVQPNTTTTHEWEHGALRVSAAVCRGATLAPRAWLGAPQGSASISREIAAPLRRSAEPRPPSQAEPPPLPQSAPPRVLRCGSREEGPTLCRSLPDVGPPRSESRARGSAKRPPTKTETEQCHKCRWSLGRSPTLA